MYIMSVEALHNYTCISFKDNKEMSVEKNTTKLMGVTKRQSSSRVGKTSVLSDCSKVYNIIQPPRIGSSIQGQNKIFGIEIGPISSTVSHS